MKRSGWWILAFAVMASGISCESAPDSVPPITSAPAASDGGSSAVPSKKTIVKLQTTKGDIVLELYPEWAPNGVKRVEDLIKIGFYDDVAFFRIVPNFIVQFGMNGNPEVNAKWADNNLVDDPRKHSNRRGYVTFAKTGRPNSRSTQLFINLKDNAFLDAQDFAPIGKVIQGLDIVEKLNDEYGEQPDQGLIGQEGDAYLKKKFPNLDRIVKATIEAAPTADKPNADKPDAS